MTLLWDGRYALVTALLAGFGRASAEVGAVMIVGGNIDHVTRVMTTAIALETSKGNLALALGLGSHPDRPGFFRSTAPPSGCATRPGGPMAERALPLAFEAVSYRIKGQTLLDRLEFRLAARPLTVVPGPNGAGKSLLLRLAQGLVQPTSGRISWNDFPVATVRRSLAPSPFSGRCCCAARPRPTCAYPLKLRGVARRRSPDPGWPRPWIGSA